MRRLAVISMHTSPLAQPGTGDGGGMNVYVRELSASLARAGIECDVFTRAEAPGLPPFIDVDPWTSGGTGVEPISTRPRSPVTQRRSQHGSGGGSTGGTGGGTGGGLRVHHIEAGPLAPVPLRDLRGVVDHFAAGILGHIGADQAARPDLLHANYWLSGLAGHQLKHELELPLVCTFHTLARVKAEAAGDEDGCRARAEAQIIGCSDAILASSPDEAEQLTRLYGGVPERIEVVPPGVDHAVFFPGDRASARAELGLGDQPVLLFAGRIQPLKGADVAVATLAALSDDRAVLVIVGGPSGPDGGSELDRLHEMVRTERLEDRVRFHPPAAHGELARYYRAADVCLVPSRSESFGLVALEAAACGTPVVAAAVGGLPSLVDHGVTGFLVDGRDPGLYAAHVDKLLSDPEEAAAMGERASARAGRYRWSVTAGRLRRIYDDLAARQLVECS